MAPLIFSEVASSQRVSGGNENPSNFVFAQPDHAVETTEQFKEEVQKLDQEVGAVVMDVDANINYIKMMKAVIHLRNPDCLFVVGGIDVVVPFEGFNILGGFLC